MVRSIRHWCNAAGLIQAGDDRTRLEPTNLGRAIFADDGFDPYLEDSATLWLIHAQLAANANRSTHGTGRSGSSIRASLERRDSPPNCSIGLKKPD